VKAWKVDASDAAAGPANAEPDQYNDAAPGGEDDLPF
jgi:hypothetical protein